MTYEHVVDGRVWRFPDLRSVLARASPPRSDDRLAGLAAESPEERLAARPALGRRLSNIHPGGLSLREAAARLWWLLREAERIGVTGVALKDRSAGGGPPNVDCHDT